MKFSTKITILSLISSVLAKDSIPSRSCEEIESYFNEINLNYGDFVRSCTEDADGNVESM